jgi:hypothetical protein
LISLHDSDTRNGSATLPHALPVLRAPRSGRVSGGDKEWLKLPYVPALRRSRARNPLQHRVLRTPHTYVCPLFFFLLHHGVRTDIICNRIAQATGTEALELVIQLGDAHVYRDHVDALRTQLTREPKPFPTIRFKRDVKDIDEFVYDDVIVEGYQSWPAIAMKMSV